MKIELSKVQEEGVFLKIGEATYPIAERIITQLLPDSLEEILECPVVGEVELEYMVGKPHPLQLMLGMVKPEGKLVFTGYKTKGTIDGAPFVHIVALDGDTVYLGHAPLAGWERECAAEFDDRSNIGVMQIDTDEVSELFAALKSAMASLK
ncbi:hypothetical protein CHOED_062 [Vibrio phage CHOED]|uniref:hypothetical protein n=1 Tax=Vibrio phage CHOED TaxID=1458716 RepID=UPI00042E430D|nr:hypothetical protein CHOED_062 [Vibrio phage CHOED]AHK11922.1 hypothetical protein CHOED_062 [Vibrio phage CHOED]